MIVPKAQEIWWLFNLLCYTVLTAAWLDCWSSNGEPAALFFRLLSQFSFKLSRDWEIPQQTKDSYRPLKEGVKDMLVKHHLFSWDL